jgi:hypothetical protein
MKALNMRLVQAAMISLSLSWDANSIAAAQYVKDPPWNPDHIDHLPAEVRRAVLATYSQNSRQINLHFEKFHCEQGPTFCTPAGCLHQVYALTAGHYHLVKKVLWKRQRLILRSNFQNTRRKIRTNLARRQLLLLRWAPINKSKGENAVSP